MFDNKGFTLVELLSIVVILAIIIVLAVPNIGKQIDKSEEEAKTILNKKIEEASHIYASKYFVSELVNCNDSSCNNISFTLNDLERDGLIKLDDDECPNDRKKKIIIKYSNGIKYNYDLNCYNK